MQRGGRRGGGGGAGGRPRGGRAAELGAATVLVTRDRFGGMAAHDGPLPVRTLAHAAWLLREARSLSRYGIAAIPPALDYRSLLARVREVVQDVTVDSGLRGAAGRRRASPSTRTRATSPSRTAHAASASGLRLRADRIVLCTGGVSAVSTCPERSLARTHSAAWALTDVPPLACW